MYLATNVTMWLNKSCAYNSFGGGVRPGQGPREVKPGQGQGMETVKIDTRDRKMKGYSQDSLCIEFSPVSNPG